MQVKIGQKMKNLFIISFFLVLFVFGCNTRSEVGEQLDGVEAMLSQNILDSANVALIDIEPATQEDSANYFVLKAETDYRLHKVPSRDEINYSIRYYETHGNDVKLANAYYYKACSFIREDSLPNEYFVLLKKAERIVEKMDDCNMQDKVYSALTYGNFAKNCVKEALKYGHKEYECALKLNNKRDVAYALIRLATAYDDCGNRDSANFYIKKCERLIDEVDDYDKSFFYNLYGEYQMQYDTAIAMDCFVNAVKYKKYSLAYKNIADIYYDRGDTANWKIYCDSALSGAWFDTKSNILSEIAQTYYDANNIAGYRQVIDSLMKNLDDYHQYEKDNFALEIQKKYDFERQQVEYEKNVWALLSIVLLMAIICLLSVFFYIKNRRTIKYLEAINAKQYATIKKSETIIQENEAELIYLVNQNEEISSKSESLASIVEANQRKIDSLQNEIEVQKINHSKEIEIGRKIYQRVLDKLPITDCKEQYAYCVYYYEITYPEDVVIFSRYSNLTIENKVFLICDGERLGYSDSDIATVLGIKESTVRSRRTKLKEKMV